MNSEEGKMAKAKHFISEDCINCYACIDICPEEAISIKDGIHVIDSDACSNCGACDDVCPADAIKLD
jgi:ferredoxin